MNLVINLEVGHCDTAEAKKYMAETVKKYSEPITELKKTVFISGSSKLKKLTDKMKACLDEIIAGGYNVIVGDCYGADIMAQEYLKDKGYTRVIVYTSTETPRHCVFPAYMSCWKESNGRSGEEFYQVKDKAMCDACDAAVAFWNGASYGVKCNIGRIRATGKPIKVILDTDI